MTGQEAQNIMDAADSRYHAANKKRWDEEDRIARRKMLSRKILAFLMLITVVPAMFFGTVYLMLNLSIWMNNL